MRYRKFLGLLVVAAAALTAFAGGASATTFTSPTGTGATPTVHFVNENGHVKFSNPIATIECSSTINWTVQSHGAGVTAEGNVTTLSLTGCTNSWHVTATFNGSFFTHWVGGYDGLLGSSGMQFDATRFGVTCVYETANTKIGNLTGGNPATLKLEGSLPINGFLSSPLCGTGSSKMEGSYVTTNALYVDQ